MKKRKTMAQIAKEANRIAKEYFKNPYLKTKPPQAEYKPREANRELLNTQQRG